MDEPPSDVDIDIESVYLLSSDSDRESCTTQREPQEEEEAVSLSFPGGGIRCAAFCHGVLEFLVENDVKIDTMCCVSGGSYTGASFVQNVFDKMERKKMAYKEAAMEFFRSKKMAKGASFILQCNSFPQAILETIVMTAFLAFFVSLFVLEKVSLWVLAITALDAVLGDALRVHGWEGIEATLTGFGIAVAVLWLGMMICKCLPKEDWIARLFNLLVVSLSITILGGLLIVEIKLLSIASTSSANTGLTIFVTLIAAVVMQPVSNILLPRGSVGVRSLLIYVTLVSMLGVWKIIKGIPSTLLFGEYSDDKWNVLLLIASIYYLFPMTIIQTTALHHFYRWKLQQHFLSNTGILGCGISRGYSLGDFKKYQGVIPTFSALAIINGWKTSARDNASHHIVTLDTKGNGTIIDPPLQFDASHYKLSSSMTVSAAAVTYKMGEMRNPFRFWQAELGLTLGYGIYTEKPGPIRYMILLFGQLLMAASGLLVVGLHFTPLLVLIPFGLAGLIILIAVISPPNNKWTNWVYYLPFVKGVYYSLNIDIIGGNPLPFSFDLSDGAHGENLALLPLLQDRKKRIIICDASEDISEGCENLLKSIRLARSCLGCSFISKDNPHADIEQALRHFSKHDSANPVFIFKVIFQPYDNHPDESEIVYLKPRKAFTELKIGTDAIETLNGCMFDTCNQKKYSFLNYFSGTFPHHPTANQFFSPMLFDQYSKLGYETAKCYYSRKT